MNDGDSLRSILSGLLGRREEMHFVCMQEVGTA